MDDEIKVLGDLEHIRLRPGMYVGSNYNPNHLIYEILDNAIDELMNKFASTITVDISNDNVITITDNGRGIAIHDIELNEKIYNSIIVACTTLKSGGKFDNTVYKYSTGLHGIGLVVVNALSKFLKVIVRDRQNKLLFHNFQFRNGELVSQTAKKISNIKWATCIEFKPDKQYFVQERFDTSVLFNKLKLIQVQYPNSIIINGTTIPKISVTEFIQEEMSLSKDIPIFNVCGKFGDSTTDCFVTYDPDSSRTAVLKGNVNLHICGGQYLNNCTTAFINIMSTKYPNISRHEILTYFRCYINVITPELEFDSQSKANMKKDLSDLFGQVNFISIVSQPYIKTIMKTIADENALKRASKKTRRKIKNKRVGALNPLKDCRQTPGDILYILEGESAEGQLSQFRNKRTEAVLPISGKIMNAVNASVDKVSNSKKFNYLLEALGAQFGTKPQTFRYDEVKILCDADSDGHHIAVLLVVGIWKYAPAIIRNKKLSIILPPLYGAVKGKQFIPLHDDSQIQYYTNQNYNIIRFKGLGEMNAEQLRIVVQDTPVEYIVQPPKNKKEIEAILQCITDTELKRKLCQNKHFSFKTLLTKTKLKKEDEDHGNTKSICNNCQT